MLDISIHAPTRGATASARLKSDLYLFQSTLPREERPCQRYIRTAEQEISIHAPTRGATLFRLYWLWVYSISIHAPTRGATHATVSSLSSPEFQSTLPREERQLLPMFDDISDDISIHAPTRGATLLAVVSYLPVVFQSTLPREERRPKGL